VNATISNEDLKCYAGRYFTTTNTQKDIARRRGNRFASVFEEHLREFERLKKRAERGSYEMSGCRLVNSSARALLFRPLHLLQAVARFAISEAPPPLCAST
jgi:hypothetical protein